MVFDYFFNGVTVKTGKKWCPHNVTQTMDENKIQYPLLVCHSSGFQDFPHPMTLIMSVLKEVVLYQCNCITEIIIKNKNKQAVSRSVKTSNCACLKHSQKIVLRNNAYTFHINWQLMKNHPSYLQSMNFSRNMTSILKITLNPLIIIQIYK